MAAVCELTINMALLISAKASYRDRQTLAWWR
jgi:hypothetical protein